MNNSINTYKAMPPLMMAPMPHFHLEGPLRYLGRLWVRLSNGHFDMFSGDDPGSAKVLPCELVAVMAHCFVAMKPRRRPPKILKVPSSGVTKIHENPSIF